MEIFVVVLNGSLVVLNLTVGYLSVSTLVKACKLVCHRPTQLTARNPSGMSKTRAYTLGAIALVWLTCLLIGVFLPSGIPTETWLMYGVPLTVGWTCGMIATHLRENSQQVSVYTKGYPGMTSLPNLPRGTTELVVEDCQTLIDLPKLPRGLTVLRLRNCAALKFCPELPDKLTVLEIHGCPALTSVKTLPSNLTDMDVSDCAALKQLPWQLPATLRFLRVKNCPSLQRRVFCVGNLNVALG